VLLARIPSFFSALPSAKPGNSRSTKKAVIPFTIVGRVVRGMDVVDKLRVPDMIKMSSLKKAGQSE
jgi:hypothetical protein